MRRLSELKDFGALKIYLASSEDILSWSYGEITKPETINYRTFRPERDGLFDERIFGPIRDYHCYCGKYKGYRYKGVICDKCGVEVAHSRVRRERMGHLKLACPVVHVWFFKGIPSKLALLLDISPRKLESVIYFSSFVVTKFDPAKKAESISKIEQSFQKQKALLEKELNDKVTKLEKPLKKLKKSDFKTEEEKLKIRQQVQALREEATEEIDELERQYNLVGKKIESIELHSVLTDVEYLNLLEYVDIFSEVSIGADAIKEILENLDLADLSARLREDLEKFKGQKVLKVSKRLRVVEGFRKANIDPARIVLDVLPVIPPELRPMVQLEGGRFATSDSNDLYRRVINRNNRLRKLLDLGAPEIIVRNEKRMLQESVDALIDSSKQRSKARSTRGRKQLKSLADQLKGKQGRFRQNLLGKRVDYSGRGVIINGPDLKLNECGIPKEMALELFKPFVLRELLARGLAPNVKSAKFVLEARGGEIWDILEELVADHPVLLNRQPTLWRLGIQAFYPKLIDGNAIRLHLCVCPGYNADFDGDQMAVLLPLSEEAIEEAKTKMLSTNNLRRPSDGIPFSVPTKIILYGIYYITSFDETLEMPDRIFGSNEEVYYVMNAEKSITVRQKIKVRVAKGEIIETTAGRLIYNDLLPENFDFINKPVGRTEVNELMTKAFETETNETVVNMIDDLKDLGIKYGTLSGNSISLNDIEVPKDREKLIDEGKDNVANINKNLARGLITEKEATRLTENVWDRVTTEIDNKVWDCLKADNPVKMLIESKATRASRNQITQIAGIRGLVFDATGKIVSVPLLGNYKIGLTAIEYFIGARGARKGLVDKGLKTADAGYLTRKLVDVAQEVIVREEDCGTENGRPIEVGKGTVLAGFPSRYEGRLLAKGVKHKGKVMFKRGRMLTIESLEKIEKTGVKKIYVRSPLDCETRRGICSKCYGHDIMTQKLIVVGSTAGVTAAQSIGEPGTQLTMRTFHTGGIAGKDITQGLPRIEELVEARAPKFLSTMSDVTGTVKISESGDERKITVIATDPDEEEQAVEYAVDPVAEIVVENNQLVAKGERLTSGHLNLTDLLRTVGVAETKKYIIEEVQKVYASQGVSINEKHIEIIVKQMFGHVKIEESGDTDFLPNSIVTKSTFEEENEKTIAEGGTPATAGVTLLGITKASLNTDSFLSAASFIQTSQVLTDAAASGKVDMLYGLKENVIIGRLIPTDERARMDDGLDEE